MCYFGLCLAHSRTPSNPLLSVSLPLLVPTSNSIPARVIFINQTVPLLLKALWCLSDVFRIKLQHAHAGPFMTWPLLLSLPASWLILTHVLDTPATLNILRCHSLPTFTSPTCGHTPNTFMKSSLLFLSTAPRHKLYSAYS